MARKAKKKTSTRKPTASSTGPRTTEDLSDDQLQVLAFGHKKKLDDLEADVKAAADVVKAKKKLVKNAEKIAVGEMGVDALEVIKDLRDFETDEGETKLTAAVQRILRSARWAGSKLETQFEMTLEPDRTPAVDRAFAEGKRAAFSGEPAKPPHNPSTEQYRRWMEGWQVGNTTRMATIVKAMDTPHSSQPKPTFAEQLHDQNEEVRTTMITPAADKIGTAAPTHVTKQ
jgi:hypothetical protein